MKNYYLFLDELHPSNVFKYFCLAGCIIEEEVYDKEIIPYINMIKDEVFGDREVILHEIEIRRAEKAPYSLMRQKKKREKFWALMKELFATPDLFATMGVAIDCADYHKLYNSDYKRDEYFIGLQVIMENFMHFLENKNGIGSILIEARNPKENRRLQNHYHTLKATGTLFYDKNAIQERLATISFPFKSDNNAGIQVADFIPNPLARHTSGKKQKNYTLHHHIMNKLYDGGLGRADRFGLKIIP
ncbi:MAG: DUF3800 domain-containing protein [Clostridium sp.]|nr:DUF3800 domain-containing protein [Clostridium sp.]